MPVPTTNSNNWERPTVHPALSDGATHVWRIPLDQSVAVDAHVAVLSDDERERVRRFYFPHHGRRYAIAHSALRQILAAYDQLDPRALQFGAGVHGKPVLLASGANGPDAPHFNLSHSGDLALLAVARRGAVGVDVEQWRTNVQHLEIADRFFSPHERDALRTLANDALPIVAAPNRDGLASGYSGSEAMLRGFFSTWSRKEAYLKATGHGIARGLHHFDVTMEVLATAALEASPVQAAVRPARLIADRLDPLATKRWEMHHIDVGPGYSGALVSTRRERGAEGAVALFESPYI